MLTLSYDEVMTLGNEGVAYKMKLLGNINEARALDDVVIRHHVDALIHLHCACTNRFP